MAPVLLVTAAAFLVAAFDTGIALRPGEVAGCLPHAARQSEVSHVDDIERGGRTDRVVAQAGAQLHSQVGEPASLETRRAAAEKSAPGLAPLIDAL